MPSTSPFRIARNSLKEGSDLPLYRQLYDLLRNQIVSGKVKKDALLPSELELVERLGVSRITARRALNDLAASGFVKRHRGRGTTVTYNAAAPNITASFENLIQGLTRMGFETDVKLIDCAFIKPSRRLSEMMELRSGERVQKIRRLRYLNNEPFSYLVTHIPSDIAAGYDPSELESASLIGLLEKTGHKPHTAHQTISAVAADNQIATALELAPGAPILRIHRLMRERGGRIIQEITSHYRGDRVKYEIDHVREEGAAWSNAE